MYRQPIMVLLFIGVTQLKNHHGVVDKSFAGNAGCFNSPDTNNNLRYE